MSDWNRIVDACETAGFERPKDLFEVSECIDKLDDQVRVLKRENNKLKNQQANEAPKQQDKALHLRGVVFSEAEVRKCSKCGAKDNIWPTGICIDCDPDFD